MSGAIIPIFEGYAYDDALTLSEPFVRPDDYSARTRDPDYEVIAENLSGMLAVRVTGDETGFDIDHVICLGANPTEDLQGDAEAFMGAYEDNIGTLQATADERIAGDPAAKAILDQISRQTVEETTRKGIQNAASIMVMKTAKGFTSGLVVPRSTIEAACLSLREIVLESRLSGKQDESPPENMGQEEFDRTIQAVLAQDPELYHAGMLAAARLFPTPGFVQNIIDQNLSARFK